MVRLDLVVPEAYVREHARAYTRYEGKVRERAQRIKADEDAAEKAAAQSQSTIPVSAALISPAASTSSSRGAASRLTPPPPAGVSQDGPNSVQVRAHESPPRKSDLPMGRRERFPALLARLNAKRVG